MAPTPEQPPERPSPGKISVIMPAYNAASFIGAAIESVLKQAYADTEIIIVDDGSTDNTLAILEPYRNIITIIRQTNAGPSAARNRGLNAATGEYVYFLDADDLACPGAFQSFTNRFHERPGASLVAGSWQEIDESGNRSGPTHQVQDMFKRFEEDWIKGCLLTCCFPVGTVMTRRQCLLDCGGWDENLKCAEDRDLWLRLAVQKHVFDFVPIAVAKYRRHSANSTLNTAKMEQHIILFLKKWFIRASVHKDIPLMKPYVYGMSYLYLARLCLEAKLEQEVLNFAQNAVDFFAEAKPDPQLTQWVLWDSFGKPWEQDVHTIFWPKCKAVVAEFPWVHGRQELRRGRLYVSLFWFLKLARKHPFYFATKVRRLLSIHNSSRPASQAISA